MTIKPKIHAGVHCYRIHGGTGGKPVCLVVRQKTWMFRGWKHSYKYIPMWEAMDL